MGKLASRPEAVAAVLQLARDQLGAKSNWQLGRMLGIDHSVMSHWTRGKTWPSPHYCRILAEAANLDADALTAYFQAHRASDPEDAQAWFRVARRLEHEALLRRKVEEFSAAAATNWIAAQQDYARLCEEGELEKAA